jgi:hypothetical protein
MNKRIFLVVLIGLLVGLVAVSIVGAQTSTDFDLSWYVMAGGGSRVDSATYAMNGTLGQGIVGISDGIDFQMQSGYWYIVSGLRRFVYLPLVLRNCP